MPLSPPKHIYSPESIQFWSEKIGLNWKTQFSPSEVSLGKEIFQNFEIRELELTETGAIVNARFDQEDCYALVDCDGESFSIRVAGQDGFLGRALAYAGFLEIVKVVATEGTPQEAKQEVTTKCEEPAQAGYNVALSKPKTNGMRPLVLQFESRLKSILFKPQWKHADGTYSLALKQGKNLPDETTPQEREKLIRLASLARRSSFQFRANAGTYVLDDLEQIKTFWDKEVGTWETYFEFDLPEELKRIPKGIQEVELTLSLVDQDEGTLDFSWDMRIGKSILEPEDCVRLIRAHHQPLLIPKVGLVALTKEKTAMLASWKDWMDSSPEDEIPKYLMFSLLKDDPVKVNLSDELKQWRESLHMIPSDNKALPEFLRSYQKQGVSWLWHLCDNNCHGLLADEMGLGKTLQILSLIASRDYYDKPNIIVCPASVVPVWEKEAKRFFPHLRTEVLKAGHDFISCEEKVLWLASYTQLRRHKFLLDRTNFGYVILDEAQHIKNPDAKVSQACMKIQSEHRIVLTGTPLENRYLDIWTLFRFLMPGLMGGRRQFEERSTNPHVQQILRKQIAPFVLRRTKEDVLKELPGKTEIECLCPLTEVQSAEYERLTSEGITQLGNDLPKAVSEQSLSFLTLLTRLRQVCCDPGLLPWMDIDFMASGKILNLIDKLEAILANGHKAVIFSQFTSLIDRIDQALAKFFPDVPRFTLTGQTKDRGEPVNDFQKLEGAGIILVSLRAGGVGITLHNADYVFLMDPWWNPAVEDQAIDRVHRIGQDKPVFVYRMITPGTIEARVQQLKVEKRDLFSGVVGAMSDISDIKNYYRSLSDLIELLPDNR